MGKTASLAGLCVLLLASFVFAEPDVTDYVIGPEDVLEVIVWESDDLSGKAAVSLEGYINFHLIGKVRASGLNTGELSRKITELLAGGYIVNPQVTVRVMEYKSQKVFIIGEVQRPGTYYLTRKTSLVEAVAMAGGLSGDADREVLVVRPKRKGPDKAQPSSPAEEGEQIRLDLSGALEGDLSQNVYLQSGDSVFVPRVKTFSIMGEVKSPGKYNLDKGTSVIKAISMAGGTTEKAAMGRTKVVRMSGDKIKETKVGMDETVQPNDIIIVPESFF